jgi:ubiquinone/menaquinone biosynthesis C-methylase UbiE
MLRSLYLWACERLYHELAPGYDVISRLVSVGAWPAWRRSVLPHIIGPRLLEIGFGTGELLAELAELPSIQVSGLELSPQMQAVTARRLAYGTGFVPRVQASASTMPLAAGCFDTIVSTFPAPYILDAATLSECARVLHQGGRLVIAGLWVRVHDARLRRALPIFYADPPGASLDQIAQRVEGAGFRVGWRYELVGWAEIPVLIGELP